MTEATQSPDQSSVAAAPVERKKMGRPRKIVEAQKAPVLVATGSADQEAPSGVVNSKTKFFKGMWAAKSNPNDPDCVRLSVNGEVITFQRSVECIVPAPYLEVAKHARFPKFKQEPGKGRKVSAYIDRFPFSQTGTATYEEFRKAFLEGTAKTRKAVETYGLNIPVEDSVPQLPQ